MMTTLTLGFAAQAAFGFVAGLVVGGAYFASLWWNTQLFTTGSAGRAIALQLGRIAAAVAVLMLLARLSLVTLLFGTLGFLVARFALLWGFGEQR
jgi:F1F0 ATPase subunit 2